MTKGKEKEVWRLEPEGEAEKLEATGLWSEVKGVSVNPEGENRHRHARAKMARKERENQTKMEKKVLVSPKPIRTIFGAFGIN